MQWRSSKARKHISALLALVMCFSMVPGMAVAANSELPTPSAEGVETFTWAPELGAVPAIGIWAPDRQAPAAFERVERGFDANPGSPGIGRLAIEGDDMPALTDPVNMFHNTQGMQTVVPTATAIAADMYVDAAAQDSRRSMGIWGVAYDEANEISWYPIIEFANRPYASRTSTTTVEKVGFRVYDGNTGQWAWADTPVIYGEWYRLEIRIINDVVRYYINDELVASGSEPALYPAGGSVGMKTIMLQAFNFGEDYDVYFDNIVPGPINYPRIATFVDYDESVLTSQSVHWNTRVDTSTAPTPTREHYTFTGWDKSLEASLTADTTFTAEYEGVDYDVAFVDYDGKVLSTQTVTYPDKAAEPTDPSREGYDFTGWYGAGATAPVSFPATVTADTTLTAGYDINTFEVRFERAYGSLYTSATVDYGTAVAEPSVEPTMAGSTFEGWYKWITTWEDNPNPSNWNDGGGKWTFETTVTADLNLRAGFAPIYKVAFDDTTKVTTGTAEYPYILTEPSDPTTTTANLLFTYWSTDSSTPFDFSKPISGDTTLTAQFGEERVVTFYSRTGVHPNLSAYTVYGDLQYVGDGGFASEPVAPVATGWDFAGWYTESYGNGVKWDEETPITANTSLYAHFVPHVYTVSFVDWDESVYDSQTANYGSAVDTPTPAPTRTGYTFDGWFDGDTKWSFTTTVTADTTLTAEYTPLKYTVAFVDYDDSLLSTATVDMDSLIPAASVEPTPTRTGYTFTGWADGADAWDLLKDKVTGDTTLTAQYDINRHKVTFLDWDGSVYTSQTVDYGSAVDTPTPKPTRDHYTFDGWFDGDTEWSFTTTVTADATLTAGYTADVYKVTFVDFDDSLLGATTVTYPGKATAPSTEPTRADYTFTGWMPSLAATVTADTTFTAQYVPNVKVAFVNGVNDSIISSTAVGAGFPIPEPADPALDGYRFIDWYSPADAVAAWSFETTVSADTTLTARFVKTYDVTFNDWDGTQLKVQTVDAGDDAVAPAAPTRTGYRFTGWDKPYANVTTDTIVTAEYTINTYTVTFKDFDGTVLKTEDVEYNTAATAPAAPVRAGYTFTGWDREFTKVTSDLLVLAQYEPIVVPVTYTVTFQDFDGTVLKTQTGIASGAAATAPANPVREGYTFIGWDRDFSSVTSDLLVKALYTPDVVPPVEADLVRHAGDDRFATAAMAALHAFPQGADTAIVAYGRDFADALSASGLAGAVDAPVLLTETGVLSPATASALETLGVTKIYIVGGTGVVGPVVENALKGIAADVERLGGANRYETSKLIAEETVAMGGSTTAAFVVRGDDFADALSVSSIATQMKMAVLLTQPTVLSVQTSSFISAVGIDNAYVAGGTGAVSADVVTELAKLAVTKRWFGDDRYDTGAAVVLGSIDEFGVGNASVGIASGANYPDALVGGPALGAKDGVLLLTNPSALSPATLAVLVELEPGITEVQFLGGTGAVSAAVERSVAAVLQ